MLVVVNPGIVFISFKYTLFVLFSMKKSTLARPFPSIALNAFFANFLISSLCSFVISAGIVIFEASSLYFASNV